MSRCQDQQDQRTPCCGDSCESFAQGGKKQGVKLWLDLAERLGRPRRGRAEVNLSHLNRYSSEGSTTVVPGKVLAAGKLDHAISVAAFKFSGAAKRKIVAAGGNALTIQQLLEQNPSGKEVKLME